MLQILNNIYQHPVFGIVSSHAGNAKGPQDSTVETIVTVLTILVIGGGFALGCYIGQRDKGRSDHQVRPDFKSTGYGSSPFSNPAQLRHSIVIPNIYLLIEGQQQGPYTKDQVRQSLADDFISPDLPAWREGLAEWVQVQSLVTPGQDPLPLPSSPIPSPREEDSPELEATPSPIPQASEPPVLLESEVVPEEEAQASPSRSPQTTGSPGLLEPKVVEVLLEMTRRRALLAKRNSRS